VHASSLPSSQRDAVAAIVVDWWRRQFRNNSATFSRGASSVQFARLADGSWQAPPGNFATLVQTGERAPERPTCGGEDAATLILKLWPAETRRWTNANVGYSITLSDSVVVSTANSLTHTAWGEGFTGPGECEEVERLHVTKLTWPSGVFITPPAEPGPLTTSLGRSIAGVVASAVQGSDRTNRNNSATRKAISICHDEKKPCSTS
jgi:hypothetical protein